MKCRVKWKKKVLGCRWKRLFKSQGKFAMKKNQGILHACNFLVHWFFWKYILNFKTTLTRSQKKRTLGVQQYKLRWSSKCQPPTVKKQLFMTAFFHYRITFLVWVINEHSAIITPLFSKGMCNGKPNISRPFPTHFNYYRIQFTNITLASHWQIFV